MSRMSKRKFTPSQASLRNIEIQARWRAQMEKYHSRAEMDFLSTTKTPRTPKSELKWRSYANSKLKKKEPRIEDKMLHLLVFVSTKRIPSSQQRIILSSLR